MKDSKKQLLWYNVALIGFAAVWGFGNVVNNYTEQGIQVIFSWVLILVLYFLPYALMVGELGSVFSTSKSGVASWIKETSNAKMAYLAAWTYWVVHIPYMAQKPQRGTIALSWFFTLSPDTIPDDRVIMMQLIYIGVFLLFVGLALLGIRSIKVLGSFAGMIIFVMSMLYVILGISAIIFGDINFATKNIQFGDFIPTFNFQYLTTFALLVFAVGGIEKMSPYVSETKDAKKNFPKAMIAVLIMVMISAIFGSIAMASMFDANNIPEDLMQNGEYYAFTILGNWYFPNNEFLSTIFVRIYAVAAAAGQFTALLLAIDAPLKILLMDSDSKYVPKVLTKTNKVGAPYVAYGLASILVIAILVLPMFSSNGNNAVFIWLTKLNSVVMPLRYLWVFLAYILLKKAMQQNKYQSDYKFVKSNKAGIIIAGWCFGFTLLACIFGMIPSGGIEANPTAFLTNIITPFVLIALGFILPLFAKEENKIEANQK